VSRAGRGRPLSVAQRKQVWDALSPLLERWRREGRADYATLCLRAREAVGRDRALVARALPGGIDAVLVDEVQDLGPPELRLLAALAGEGEDRLFLTGDGGQRIYGRRLSLGACGIPVRGRSFILRVNYRTTAQIRRFADRVLPENGDDLDGGQERRGAVRSILSGAPPELLGCATPASEVEAIAREINAWIEAGYAPEEIAVFARTNPRADHLRRALRERGLAAKNLDPAGRAVTDARGVTVTTLHRAKGMEYKAVVVAGASRDLLPLPAVLNEAGDPADLEDALTREAQLLYVGLTRARDRLLVTWTGEPSAYLEEALTAPGAAAGPGALA
jgi:superfamily I DNA/RNA helicase